MYTGGNAVEINTEADRTDMTECPYDDKPSTGMFGFFLALNVFNQETQLSLKGHTCASYSRQERNSSVI